MKPLLDTHHVDLEITYRDGRPRLGYLYLSEPSEKSARSRRISVEMVIDINKDGQLIGIELLDPENTTIESHQRRAQAVRPRTHPRIRP